MKKMFNGITIEEDNKGQRIINSKQFYQAVIDSMRQRITNVDNGNIIVKNVNALVPETWPEELGTEFGEAEVSNLCDFFHILFSQVKQEYRDFKESRSLKGDLAA